MLLLKGTSNDFYDAPSFSPDGSHIVFVSTIYNATGQPTTEIRTINVDGTDLHSLFKAPAIGPPVYFGYPHYSSDGSSIYFSIVVAGATPRENKFQIVRGPASGGEWTLMLDNGYMPHFSLDSKRVTFLRANPQTFYTSLWVANANGTSTQQLVADDVFLEVTGPHFSPDGQWIVFAASGPPQKKLPTSQLPSALNRPADVQSEPESCAVWFVFACLVSRAYANGLPWELWLVSMNGKSFKQLTKLQLDSPWPAFSRNGRYIGFMTFEGAFEYDHETNRVTKLSSEGGHGVIDWFQN